MLTRKNSSLLILGFTVFTAVFLFLSCSAKPIDLRSIAPADSLIYLETNDIAVTLQPLIDSNAFVEAAKAKPDLSALKGVQLAIVVTGFEASEEQVNDANSVLNFKAHFVAIADTHAWQWQTNSFAENQLGEFVNKMYGGGVQLDTVPKNGGTEYVWSAEDGRKAYAFVVGSLILFGNDDSAIEKVQAVRRGESPAFAQNGKELTRAAGETIAAGYVSTDGIAQLSNILGAQRAKESGEEAEVQSFVARVLPQLLRGAVTEATWTAQRTEQGIDDRLFLKLNGDIAPIFNETLAPAENDDTSLLDLAPSDAATVTRYSFKDPQIAWRSVLLAVQKMIDPESAKIVVALSNSFFEPYGIKDGEGFLGAVSSNIVTVKYEDEDDVAVIARAKDQRGLASFVDPDVAKSPGSVIQMTESGFENISLIGNAEIVAKCTQAHQSGKNISKQPPAFKSLDSRPTIQTYGIDRDTAVILADILNERKSDSVTSSSRYVVETRFNSRGMERRLVSEFGLIGSIISLLSNNE